MNKEELYKMAKVKLSSVYGKICRPDPEKDLPAPDEDMKILEACEEYSKTGFDEFDFYATYYDD